MKKHHSLMIVQNVTCAFLLGACNWYGHGTQSAHNSTYSAWGDYDESLVTIPRKKVTVPHSYHFAQHTSPRSHRNRDQDWINRQNPQQYTIELANQKSAAGVAKILHNTPKNKRMAQIAYEGSHTTKYLGVYGNFATPEAAKEALKKLPPHLQQQAYVTQWEKVQRLKPKATHVQDNKIVQKHTIDQNHKIDQSVSKKE